MSQLSPYLFALGKNKNTKIKSYLLALGKNKYAKIDAYAIGLFQDMESQGLLNVDDNFSTQREIQITTTLNLSTSRSLAYPTTSLSVSTQREIQAAINLNLSTSRTLVSPEVNLNLSTQKEIVKTISLDADVFMAINNVAEELDVNINYATERELCINIACKCDTSADIRQKYNSNVRTALKIPFDTTFLPANHELPAKHHLHPARQPKSGPTSMQIILNEQTLQDRFKLSTTQEIDIWDCIKGKILDFSYSYTIEDIQWQNLVRNATGYIDNDLYLYNSYNFEKSPKKNNSNHGSGHSGGMKYSITLSSENGGEEPATGRTGYATALEVSRMLSKTLYYYGRDFQLQNALGAIQNYSTILSSVFGWSSQIPSAMFNVFIRENKKAFYVVQRGYEPNTIDLTNTKHTRPNIQKELVRTASNYTEKSATHSHDLYRDYMYWTERELSPLEAEIHATFDDCNCTFTSGGRGGFSGTENGSSYSGSSDSGSPRSMKKSFSDGSKSHVVYDYDEGEGKSPSLWGGEVETFTDSDGGGWVKRTYHTPLGGGWYNNSVYVDDEYQGSTLSQGDIFAEPSDFSCRNESLAHFLLTHTLHMGKEKYDTVTSESEWIDEEINIPLSSNDKNTYLRILKDLNRSIKETITFDLYEYGHVVDFTDKIIFRDNTYYLVSNNIKQDIKSLKQTITMVRWYK